MTDKFLSYFPNHVYRYIDLTGQGRAPQSCAKIKEELNIQGYESYFTVNGFRDTPNAKKDQCTNLNAFFVDIDGRKNLEELEEIKKKLDPTFIIETQNGYHIYWLLKEVIYKDKEHSDDWDSDTTFWENIEQSIVTTLNADKAVKDMTRILRVPDTYYWKKTGDQWTKGVEGVFVIRGLYKEPTHIYSMEEVAKAFPWTTAEVTTSVKELVKPTTTLEKKKEMAEVERDSFFERVNEEFPIEDRDSFKKIIKAGPDTLPPKNRNNALVVAVSLMKQAKWSRNKIIKHIQKTGWHGIETEAGGLQEISNTVNSALESDYTYSYKNEIISRNMSPVENQKIQEAHVKVIKERKDQDKVRFSNYEREILVRHPNLRKNEIGIIYRYDKGVYKVMSDQEVSDMVLNCLFDDLLWGYRTKKNVSDKVACLLSIIPPLVISDDGGYLANVKNGILNIYTKELMPHSPDFVSLIQYPVDFNPIAPAPIWEKCINEWMAGPEQENKIKLLKQFCGYCLSSSMLYDRALFMVGDGGNGKSTFIDTISMVIGSEATSHIDLEGLYGSFGMHGLIGKRLNVIEEVHGNYYQSNKLKKLISGEQITIDIKYKPQFTFRPQAKFVFSVNILPRVDDTSTATERRICAISFLNNYRDKPNYELRSSFGLLAQELSGILNWMIDGAIDLANDKEFITTDEQIKMLDEYRAENSSVEGFLSQCITLDPESSIEAPKLYAEYKHWSETDGGRKTKANITFTKEVTAYGKKGNRFTFEPRQHSGGESKFVGIALNRQWLDQYEGLLAGWGNKNNK